MQDPRPAQGQIEVSASVAGARGSGRGIRRLNPGKACLLQSTISNYPGLLKQAGLVISERRGQFTFYRRDEDTIRAFLSAFERELSKR
jgi:DNA-binding transcriptional ArsR family regulator